MTIRQLIKALQDHLALVNDQHDEPIDQDVAIWLERGDIPAGEPSGVRLNIRHVYEGEDGDMLWLVTRL